MKNYLPHGFMSEERNGVTFKMAEYTSNYNLYKPSRKDDVVVDESLTENFNKIDTEIMNRQNSIESNAESIAELKNTTTDHGDDISTLQENVSTNATDISSLEETTKEHGEDITSLEEGVSGNASDISSLATVVSENKSNIEGLQESVTTNNSNIKALQEQTESLDNDTSTNAENISTLTENVGTLDDLDTEDKTNIVNAINELIERLPKINKGVFTHSGDGSTTVTIPHELGEAPFYYQVQEASEDTADISFIEVDETNITVHFKEELPEGEDNISLVWRAEL